ncbi:DNA-processing protein DprA [Uruburuella testudinis]|uniref:DNA-processing protein DprA n=1 Tax=Uruburuella testudinis TaxID=1282863 RepID=A0ABY4DYP9_9NEIS|nr:DNA-processing protein DprA [Uruburuella testudinis]UOO81801.1 DNA-processing protein DprA [Uruburuella testudinis]
MNDDQRFAWIQLALTPYVGAESFLLLLQRFGSPQAALAAPPDAVRECLHHKQALAAWAGDNRQAVAAAEAAMVWAAQDGCRVMLLCDDDFPVMLTEGMTPPPLLFLRGNADLLHQASVAVVGSRHATPQAMRIAKDFGEAMGGRGIAVVSGMAAGIDTAAHQGALQAGGGTIAVWGTGIDRIYPPGNKPLAYQIAEQGLIVSEFPLGTRPLAGNFPRRNRIIAALAQATLVVEAAPESGSLITARLAAEMGREVMAVPGSIDNPHSKGCHKLIKEGAKLVECLDDIVQECPQLLQKQPMSSYAIYKEAPAGRKSFDKPSEQVKQSAAPPVPKDAPLLEAMGYDPIHPDSLAQQLQLSAADVYARLLELELEGAVAAMPGGRYQRI